jgi:hypothetical protein
MLDVPPIKTWADITDQKVGTNAISNAPAASATVPAAINARLDRRPVNQRSRWRLHENSCDPTDREREADALFVPPVASKVNREEWSDSRLHVGKEKIQPVQTA